MLKNVYIDICNNLKYFIKLENLEENTHINRNKSIIKMKYILYTKKVCIKEIEDKQNIVYIIYWNNNIRFIKLVKAIKKIIRKVENYNKIYLSDQLIEIVKRI